MHIYGRNTVLEALASQKKIEKIFIAYGTQGEAIDHIWKAARSKGVTCGTMDKRKFAALEKEIGAQSARTQGVIALVSSVDILSVTELIEHSYALTDTPLLVALDGITDPHNLGAIARSAEGAGAQGLILPERNAAPLTGVAMKTSAGALEHLAVAKANTISLALQDVRNAGFTVIGTDDSAQHLYTEELYDNPTVLVIGNEGEGMHPAVQSKCDMLVRIPMAGRVSSLNASVSTGVVLFEIVRQRARGESRGE